MRGALKRRCFLRRTLVRDDTAIAKGDDSFGIGGHLGLMRHQQDGEPVLPVERAKIDMISLLVVVSSAPVGSSASNTSGSLTRARAIATRCCSPPESFAGVREARSRKPQCVQRCLGAPTPLTPSHAPIQQRYLDVLQRAHARQKVEILEDEAELSIADRRERIASQPGDIDPVQFVRARGRPSETPHEVQKRRLARPRRPHHSDELTTFNGQADAVDGPDERVADAVAVAQ